MRLIQPVKRSVLADGNTLGIGQPGSYWTGSWQSEVLVGRKIGEMSAWLNSLKGGGLQFMGRDPQYCGTYLHADFAQFTLGGQTFSGETVIDEIVALNEVRMSLPAGFDLVPGDKFQVVEGAWHRLVEVEQAVAVAVEGVVNVIFNAPLPVGAFEAGSQVSFNNPGVPMVFSNVNDPENVGAGKRFSFSGRSV